MRTTRVIETTLQVMQSRASASANTFLSQSATTSVTMKTKNASEKSFNTLTNRIPTLAIETLTSTTPSPTTANQR